MDNLLLRKKDKSNDIFDWNSYYFKSLCINCFKLGFFKVFKCLHNSDHAWNTQQRFFLDLLSESHTLSFFGYFSASKSCNVYSMRFYSNDDSTQIMDHTTQRSMFDNKKIVLIFRRKSYISLNHCSLLYIVYIIKFVDICIKN